jgi:hypothetical protein
LTGRTTDTTGRVAADGTEGADGRTEDPVLR